MAIYHLNVKIGSKMKGQSANAKYNYIMREDKYSASKKELLHQDFGNLPQFAENNPKFFWQSADDYERLNGRLFTQIEFALPRELSTEQIIELAKTFAEKVCSQNTYKLPYSLAIHSGEYDHAGNKIKEERTPHCHLIFSSRSIDDFNRTAEHHFSRANKKEREKGGAWREEAIRSKDWLRDTRKLWADTANEALEKAGISERIDHRSLEAQGIDREPQHKQYWNTITKIEEIKIIEDELKQTQKEIKEIKQEIEKELNKIISEIVEKIKNTPNTEINEKTIETLKKNYNKQYQEKGKNGVEELHNFYLEELARRKTEAEKKAKAEEEARRKAEEEKARLEAEEAKRKAEEAETKKREFLEEQIAYLVSEYKRLEQHPIDEKAQETLKRMWGKTYDEKGSNAIEKQVKQLIRKAKEEAEERARIEAKAKDKELADMFDGFYKALDNNKEEEKAKLEAEAKKEEARKKAELEAKRKAEEEAKAKAEAETREKTEAEAFNGNVFLTGKLEYFNYQHKYFTQRELTEQEKAFFKNRFSQEYENGGLLALNTYINSYLTKLEAGVSEGLNPHLKAMAEFETQKKGKEQSKSNLVYQTTTAPQAQAQQQPQQPQTPNLLPDYSSWGHNPAKVGQKVFELLGGNEETGQMPNLRKLPQAIEELKRQGFAINESKLNKAIKQARAGEIDAIDLSNAFADSISPQSMVMSKQRVL